MLQGVSSISTSMVPNLVGFRSGAEKITVPLKPSRSLVAQFKHITTVPSNSDKNGVPVYKLRILDNLIERLTSRKEKAEEFAEVSPDNIDNLISNLQKQVSLKESSFHPFYSNLKPETGLILDFFV